MTVAIGKKVPDFAAATTGAEFKLSNFKGKVVIVYFYPKDSTPGCTTEGTDFKDAFDAFTKANAVIFGISRDSVKSHSNFKSKFEFPFELISDPDEMVCAIFEVMKMKNMYGKQVRGIERSTFVIDSAGKLAMQWRGLKVPGHVKDVLSFVQSL